MKQAYLSFANWQVEAPVLIKGIMYRVDAMNQTTGRIREFVHSLSPRYIMKHRDMAWAGFDCTWILDGEMFVSANRKCVHGWDSCGYKGMLKPKAFEVFEDLPTLIHFEDRLWRRWKGNIWYPCSGKASEEIIARFDTAKKEQV